MKPETNKFYLITLDPVHIGTGGYRLGRVDNTIVREVGTRVPKIPGTAIHGAVRHYAAHRFGKPQCAGQRGHCGEDTCPICYTFGAIKDNRAKAGVVSISDARIVLFPVYSMFGPVWITTPERLRDSGLMDNPPTPEDDKVIWNDGLTPEGYINLGWLMVEGRAESLGLNGNHIPDEIKNRIVVVSERLFTHVVNSNLEVRTSVSINPQTGAAEEGALFTYEAIPRATILWMDVVVRDFKDSFPSREKWTEIIQREGLFTNPDDWGDLPDEMQDQEHPVERVLRELRYISERPQGNDERSKEYWNDLKEIYEGFKDTFRRYIEFNLNWNSPLDVITVGLQWAEHLGIGGMGTRGFGRVRCLSCPFSAQETPSETTQEDQVAPAQTSDSTPDGGGEG